MLANHESPLRPRRFVNQKIISSVKSIKAGHQEKLELGNLDIWRDWGWAPQYVQAMHLLLQQVQPSDFIIATGITSSLDNFVELAFTAAGLHAEDLLQTYSSLLRPSDLKYSAMDPSRINTLLGWRSTYGLAEIVERMLADQL